MKSDKNMTKSRACAPQCAQMPVAEMPAGIADTLKEREAYVQTTITYQDIAHDFMLEADQEVYRAAKAANLEDPIEQLSLAAVTTWEKDAQSTDRAAERQAKQDGPVATSSSFLKALAYTRKLEASLAWIEVQIADKNKELAVLALEMEQAHAAILRASREISARSDYVE